MSYRVSRGTLLLAAALLSTFPAAPAPAQQPAQTVPVELAAAFVRTYARPDSAATVEFLPGEVPAAVRDVIPIIPGARIIGSVVLSRATTVLGTSTLSPDSVLAWYASTYTKRGLPAMALVRVQTSPPGIGGFRQPPPAHPSQFCSGSDQIDVVATRSPEGWSDFRVRFSGGSPLCRMVPPTPLRTPPNFGLPLPVVYDPPNTATRPECFANNSRQQQTQTQLYTVLSPDSLLRHYGRQLETAGWTRVPAESTVVTGMWTRRDSTGVLQAAKLSIGVMPGAPDCRSASLEVTTMRNR
ncbi:MAG TPA: hypothetical protein VLN49_16975 [Gemmatimonadaceae bacterium]|nr:hypothetical protein [Gemmatimonadaceae bacterium]